MEKAFNGIQRQRKTSKYVELPYLFTRKISRGGVYIIKPTTTTFYWPDAVNPWLDLNGPIIHTIKCIGLDGFQCLFYGAGLGIMNL